MARHGARGSRCRPACRHASGTSKFITTMPRVIVGYPTYFDRAGMPLVPADLTEHRIVGGPAATRAASWQFERDGEEVNVELHPNISTNSIAGAIACATGNLGITSAPLWGCQDELQRGKSRERSWNL
ncbi:LysR substrate-binding domain-containing protein [Caballeronia sp. 15715]|uniref:LysR substrate-binding domain-containing protein n=2 Tax=unclassified Caballeronia TaxID=2646786 RepID=UPI0039E3EE5E